MIRASAGSGKTYQLANRFLALLALGVDPAAIIALTFTRKAAGEFADRILARLAEGASGPEKAAKLAAELTSVLRGDPETGQPALARPDEPIPTLDQARFREMLECLVRSLDRLALGTIDAFFGKIARNSWNELGLAGFELLDEAEKEVERERVFGKIFSRLRENDQRREDFLQAFKRATFGTDENRFVEKLIDFIESTQSTLLKVRDPEAWGNESRLWPTGCPWPKYESILFKRWTKQLRTLTDGRDWGHANWSKSWEKLLVFLDDYEPAKPKFDPPLFENYLGPNLRDLATGAAEWTYARKQIRMDGQVAALTADLLGAMIGAEIKAALLQTRGTRDVILRYEREYETEVRRRGRLGFADLTTVLADAGLGDSATGQNIAYRLDQRFEHWMLDEFQDTDRLQWRVLAGLIEEIAQEEDGQRTFFVVGDPKQGIHAWRGGEPRLFEEIAASWQGRLPEWSMDRSFRSSPAVLEFVNLLCDPEGPGLRANFDNGPFAASALERWKFHPHLAACPDRTGESLVIEVASADDAGDDDGAGAEEGSGEEDGPVKDAKLPWLAVRGIIDRVRPLERGLTCAILVQTNKAATAMADFLRVKCPDWPVEVESETATENAGPVVAALYDFFRWLETPADRFAWGHVRHCPLFGTLAGVFGTDKPDGIWNSTRLVFQSHGAAGLLDLVFPALRHRVDLDPSQAARLTLWETEARRFDARGGSLADWVRLLRHWKTREWSGAGAIQIMTIHKAKGLEFDLVLLPDLDGKGFDDLGKLDRLQERAPDGSIHLLFDAPPKHTIEADPRLAELREQWEADLTYERFCTLYVAITRAARALVLVLPPSLTAKGEAVKAKKNHASWVRAALDGKQPATPALEIPGLATRTLWRHGDPGWFEAEPIHAAPPLATDLVPLNTPQARLASRTPSSRKSPAAGSIQVSSRDRNQAMAFGSALHAAFERVGWLDEGALSWPADPALRKLLEACFAAPDLRQLFTRDGRDVQLLREQPFDTIRDGVWTSGVIDRLHLHRESGRVISAEVIDFKSDAVPCTDELAEKYGGQMRAYRSAVADITGLAPDTIRCLLVSTRLAAIAEIPHP